MPSGANSGPLDTIGARPPLTFFLDRQIGKYVVASALRGAGAVIEVHDDHFPQATPDLDWMPVIGARGWVLVTRDRNIWRNSLERTAYQHARLRGFIVTGVMGGQELGELLVSCLPRMIRKISRASGPLIYTISRGGSFTKLKD